jgi:hypothetical protein
VSGTRETRFIQEMLQERSPAKRREALADFAGVGGEAAIVQAIGVLKKAGKSPRQADALDELFHAWGKVAPLNAIKALATEPLRTQWGWQKQILTGWADIDPPAVWSWLQQNVPSETAGTIWQQGIRYEQYNAVVEYLLKNDRSRDVEALLASTTDSRLKQGLGGNLVQYFANYDLPAGVSWLNEQPPGATRNNAVSIITSSIAAQAPDVAIPFAMGFASMPDRMQALRTAFGAWGKLEDFSAATRWIMEEKTVLPEMSAALSGFIPEIAARDHELAIKLINERSDLLDRESLVRLAVSKLNMVSADRALAVIVGVPINPKRAEHLSMVVTAWNARDPETARAAINGQTGLTGAERESLLGLVPR